MSQVDLHPEELLDRARRGQASADELARLETHLEVCKSCKFEQRFAADCERAAAPANADEAMLARIRASALAGSRPRSAPAWRSAFAGRRSIALAVAASLCLVSIGAAALILARAFREPKQVAPYSTPAPSSAPALKRVPSRARVLPSSAVEAPASSTLAPAPNASSAVVAPSAAPQAPAVGAKELFARANQARRSGELGEAVRLYAELQRTFPGSSEALVSRVALGRLLLDRMGNPGGALAQFDAYLAGAGHGALREEALIGRALALGRLGRRAEERGAWSALLTGYPESAYAGRARARLERLHQMP